MVMGFCSCCDNCSFYDDLSECHNVDLYYRYIPIDKDEYESNVSSLRHFLFDEKGLFVKEIPQSKEHPQKLHLSGLPIGHYTMLTLGNITESKTFFTSFLVKKSTLEEAILQLQKRFDQEAFSSSEELFWNFKKFEVKQAPDQSYICDLANIHCHLIYQVSWQSVPPEEGTYRVELSNLSQGYSLDPMKSGLSLSIDRGQGVIHQFPQHSEGKITIAQDVLLMNHELNSSFISLRYLNNRIPSFQIKKGEKSITKPLDLSLAFEQFNWYPDRRAEQIYRIQIRINDDGTVLIRPWVTGSVEDWQSGGTIIQ